MSAQVVIEKYFLASLFHKPELINDTENFCVSNIGKALYSAVKKLVSENRKVTSSNVFYEAHILHSALKEETVQHLFEDVQIDLDSFQTYYDFVRKESLREEMKELSKDIVVGVQTTETYNVNALKEAVHLIRHKIDEFDQKVELLEPKIIMDSFKEDLHDRLVDNNQLSFGSSALTKVMGTPLPGELTLLFARPSMGKTAFAINLFDGIINQRVPVIYFTLEMSRTAITQRHIAKRLGINYSFFNNLEQDETKYEQQLALIEKKLKKSFNLFHKFAIVDASNLSISDMERLTNKFKEKHNAKSAMIIVDLLSMVSDFKNNSNQQTAIQYGVDDLSGMLKRTDTHCIGLIQANRSTEGGKKITKETDIDLFRPTLTNLKSSGAWEERARFVLGIHRPKYYYNRYFPDMKDLVQNIMEVQLLKGSSVSEDQDLIKYFYYADKMQCIPYIRRDEEDE